MRKLVISALIACSALASALSGAQAQGYLDQYRGRNINEVKSTLWSQGFRERGHLTIRRGTYALMFDGRSCIGLHGGQGRIDDIVMLSPRDCGAPPPPPPGYRPPPPPPGWGAPPPPPWGGPPPPPPRY